MILAGSGPGDVVLDPFAGSGTTLAVATRLGRNGWGIDLSTEYADLIHQRMAGQLLALMLNVITSTNPTATKVSRSVTPGTPENQPQGLGFALGVRRKPMASTKTRMTMAEPRVCTLHSPSERYDDSAISQTHDKKN